MSARRAARARRQAATDDGMPAPLRLRTDPLWEDRAAILARFGDYLTGAERAAVVAGALRPYQRILSRWAVAHGHTGPDGRPDWRALSQAGWGSQSGPKHNNEGKPE